jgi:hypothetical protein
VLWSCAVLCNQLSRGDGCKTDVAHVMSLQSEPRKNRMENVVPRAGGGSIRRAHWRLE